MKVIDHAGNSLQVGRLLYWKPQDLYVKVKDVMAPTGAEPGRVVVEVTFGITPAKTGQAVQFKDFITVFDPEEELRTEAALENAQKKSHPHLVAGAS